MPSRITRFSRKCWNRSQRRSPIDRFGDGRSGAIRSAWRRRPTLWPDRPHGFFNTTAKAIDIGQDQAAARSFDHAILG